MTECMFQNLLCFLMLHRHRIWHSRLGVSLPSESIISNKGVTTLLHAVALLHLVATNTQPTKLSVLVIYPLVIMSAERSSDPILTFAEEMIEAQMIN